MQPYSVSALAFAVHDLFVGEHGVAVRAPVDRRRGAIGETLLVQLQKAPLRPFIILGHAGLDFIVPVEGAAHGF